MPWFVWTSLASVTLVLAGTYWDISWHMTVGRDSFWTPAHVAIQLGGIVAGVAGIVLVLGTTLRRDAPLRAASIRVLGFRGPFGAFLAAWGAATMLVSAPFDDWWHSAYGLDVKILSPPHAVLSLGILGVVTGGMALVLATTNRAGGAGHRWVLLVLGGELCVLLMTSILEHTFRANLHRADAYRAVSLIAPLVLVGSARLALHRWTATLVAGGYTLFMVGMLWVFPLFPAEPKLGPVYQPITHFVPLEFPMLIVAPALAIDLVRGRLAAWSPWRLGPLLGVVFLSVLVAVEWPFASFLQTPAARTWVFGTHHLPYFMRPEWFEASYRFVPDEARASGMVQALAAAMATSTLGLALGDAMRRVRR